MNFNNRMGTRYEKDCYEAGQEWAAREASLEELEANDAMANTVIFNGLGFLPSHIYERDSENDNELFWHFQDGVEDMWKKIKERLESKGSGRNLFLAPGSRENIEDSIQHPVSLQRAEQFLSPNSYAMLESRTQSDEGFYCFAMTKGSQSYFEAMNPGDFVIFKANRTSRLEYKGRVMLKARCPALGRDLWGVGEDWDLIYFMKNITRINIDFHLLKEELGYKENYDLPGIIRASPDRMRRVISRHGNINNFLNDLDQLAND